MTPAEKNRSKKEGRNPTNASRGIMQAIQAIQAIRYLTPRSTLNNSILPFMQLDSALGAVPLGCTRGNLSQAHTVKVEPFPITLQHVSG